MAAELTVVVIPHYSDTIAASVCMSDVFFFNDTATTEIYTLSLHDALPIWLGETRCTTMVRSGALLTVVIPRRRTSSGRRSEEHTSELQSQSNLVCRLLLEKKKKQTAREGLSVPRKRSETASSHALRVVGRG